MPVPKYISSGVCPWNAESQGIPRRIARPYTRRGGIAKVVLALIGSIVAVCVFVPTILWLTAWVKAYSVRMEQEARQKIEREEQSRNEAHRQEIATILKDFHDTFPEKQIKGKWLQQSKNADASTAEKHAFVFGETKCLRYIPNGGVNVLSFCFNLEQAEESRKRLPSFIHPAEVPDIASGCEPRTCWNDRTTN